MPATTHGIDVERHERVVTITLNRPSCGNAINLSMARSLLAAAIECDTDETVRCVLLTGNGRFFCAGGDLASFADAGENISRELKEVTSNLHAAIAIFARMNKPLVTAVNGPAAGAGLSLAVLGDIVLASKSAQFTCAYTAVGLCPDGGATWLLPRLIGLRRAQEMSLRNSRIGAEEAVAIGLATRVVDAAGLRQEAAALTSELADAATSALGATRQLLLASFASTLETQMELEGRAISSLAGCPNGVEGISAFVQKREPTFR